MLKDIPEYDFNDISLVDFIKDKAIPVIVPEQSNTPHSSFLPIRDSRETPPTSSIGQSKREELAKRNNESTTRSPSRSLQSGLSPTSKSNYMIDLLFKIPYPNNGNSRLIAYDEQKNDFVIYITQSHKLEYLPRRSRQIVPISLPFNEAILNLGYSKLHRLFYIAVKQINRFILFRIKDQQMEIVQDIDLIHEQDHFISAHIYKTIIVFLYLSQSKVICGKYDLDTSSVIQRMNLESKLYDPNEKKKYHVTDFTINDSFIAFLVRLRSETPKWMIAVYDAKNIERICSFDLIDPYHPLSIISVETKDSTCNDDMENSFLLINDPKSHQIHCCNYQHYQSSIHINAFGICTLTDGNIGLIGSRDIRGLK
ncbi:unnamed protein product, partial [Adineta ricciae]